MTQPTLEQMLDEFDLTSVPPRKPDRAAQIASDRRAITAARFNGHRTRSAIIRATALSPYRYDRAIGDEANSAGPSEMEQRDQRIAAAYRRGCRTVAAISNKTGIGSDQVRSSAKRLGLELADGRPKAKASPEVVHRRNLERRARERRKREDVEACRGRR